MYFQLIGSLLTFICRRECIPYFMQRRRWNSNTVNPGDVCGSSAASAPPSIYDTVDRKKPTHEYIGFPPASRGNLEHNTLRDPSAGSHKRTSSLSSVIGSTRGVKRSRREQSNNLEDHVDIYGDHQIAKQEREDGHPQRPFSRCDAD